MYVNFKLSISIADIEDENDELATALTEKYLGDADMGNFASMTPGLTDVSGLHKLQVEFEITIWFIEQLCSVLFLKAPTYEMMQYHSDHNANSYFYAFNFEGRNSLFTYIFIRDPPPIPHGMSIVSICQ